MRRIVGVIAARSEHEQALEYCPVCGNKLKPIKCKLVCKTCGYYLSCSDYV